MYVERELNELDKVVTKKAYKPWVPKAFRAKYPGYCQLCKRKVFPGQQILKLSLGGVTHANH